VIGVGVGVCVSRAIPGVCAVWQCVRVKKAAAASQYKIVLRFFLIAFRFSPFPSVVCGKDNGLAGAAEPTRSNWTGAALVSQIWKSTAGHCGRLL